MAVRHFARLLGCFVLFLAGPLFAETPTLQITSPGGCEVGENSWTSLSGITKGADAGRHSVVIYSVTNTGYVQPYTVRPYTGIDAETGNWTSEIHGGFNYWALLVTTDVFTPPHTSQTIPEGDGILARDLVPCAAK